VSAPVLVLALVAAAQGGGLCYVERVAAPGDGLRIAFGHSH